MKLNEIPKQSKIFCEVSDDSKYVTFDHLDGLYSYCVSEKGAVIHLSRFTPLTAVEGGYKIDETEHL
jgi:hypothetical protein